MKKYTVLLIIMICLFLSACSLLEGLSLDTTVQDDSTSAAGDEESANGDEVASGGKSTGESDYTGIIESTGEIGNTGESEGTVKGVMKLDASNGAEVKREKLPMVLYYQDRDGYIIPVTRRLDKQEGIARAALSWLEDSAVNREELQYFGIYPILPEGTEILGMTIKEGTAIVDFNEKLLDYEDHKAEMNIVASIVYTLTEFKTISNVRILINGYSKEKLKFGTEISDLLDRGNILVNSSGANRGQDKDKLDVYMLRNVTDRFSYLLPVSIEFDGLHEEDIPGEIVELLNSDFDEAGFYSEIPPETGLIDSSVSDGLLILDFNSSILDYGGASRENMIINQILLSMKQIKGVDKVKILVDGKDVTLPEGTETSAEMRLPAFVNDVIDG